MRKTTASISRFKSEKPAILQVEAPMEGIIRVAVRSVC